MSLTNDQLADLHALISERLAEFKPMTMPILNKGAVRTIYIAIEEWQQEQDEQVLDDYANARQAAYEKGRLDAISEAREEIWTEGWKAGRESKRREMEIIETYGEKPTIAPTPPAPPLQVVGIGDDPHAYHTGGLPAVTTDHTNGNGDYADLASHWPAMPDLTGGIDHFAQHPVAGEPEASQKSDEKYSNGEPLAVQREPPPIELPERTDRRSVQRERVASAQAKGRNGNVLPTREEIVAELKRQAMGGVMPTRGQFDESKPANWATAWAHMQRLNVKWEELRLEAGLKPNPRVAARIEA